MSLAHQAWYPSEQQGAVRPAPVPIKVVYIAGAGRSGTTLLDVLLGELDGFFSGGEVRWLWWGLLHGWRCGCGLELRRCPTWTSILERAFGRVPDDPSIERVMRQQQAAVRLHYLPRILTKRADRPTRWDALDACIDTAARLYASIAEVTGARVIVDSSKNAAEAALLRLVPNVEPYLVQLTRDPRAVANSMQRTVKMEPMAATTFDQPRHGSAISALIWTRKNAAADMTRLRFPATRSRLVRYEDLVSEPQKTLESLAELVDEPFSGAGFSGDRTVELHGNHSAWGNPSRFKTGPTELRIDDEWITRLNTMDRLVPAALSLPLLLRYRYPLTRSRAAARASARVSG